MIRRIAIVNVGEGLKFCTRPGSSDLKAIQEVITRRGYVTKGFDLQAKTWADLGANIGAFTVLTAKAGSRVVAYEPDPDSFYLLKRNVELNKVCGQVELVHAAVVTDQRTSAVLHVNSANGNFWRNSIERRWRGGQDVDVPAIHLDSISTAGCWKMDIEGTEMAILEKMIAFPTRMVFEWSFDVDASIPRFREVVRKLRQHYGTIKYGKFDEKQVVWGKSWFPPCKTVWCY